MPRERSPSRKAMDELKRMADDVCLLILHTDLPEIDIQIQINEVRRRCEQLFPDRLSLFEMVYASRFRRLMEQWHENDDALGHPSDEAELV